MEPLSRKTWIVLWALPLLFFVVSGIVLLNEYRDSHDVKIAQKQDLDVEQDLEFPNAGIIKESGDDMALAEQYEVTGGAPGWAGIYTVEEIAGNGNGLFKMNNDHFLRLSADYPNGEFSWGYLVDFEEGEGMDAVYDYDPDYGWSGNITVTAVASEPMPEAFQVTGTPYQDGKYTRESDTKYTLSANAYLRYVYIDVADMNAWVITDRASGDLSVEDDAFYVNFNAPKNDPTGSDYFSFLDGPEYNSPATVSAVVPEPEAPQDKNLILRNGKMVAIDMEGDSLPIPQVKTYTSETAITPDTDEYEAIHITAQARNLEFKNPTGEVGGRRLLIRIKDNGTARTLTWNNKYRAIGGNTLPTTTDPNATMYVGFIYNAEDDKYDLVAVS